MKLRKLGIAYDDLYLQHRPPAGHLERPERLGHLMGHLRQSGVYDRCMPVRPVRAGEEEVLLVHSRDHLEFVRAVCARGGGPLDSVGDTYASAASLDAALLAAGAGIAAVDAVLTGSADAVFCAVRPPGHHAGKGGPMGFCIFNNIAIAARYAQSKHGREKIAILDWDVHHGNGTQEIFEEDPSVLFISIHRYPFYPGTGAREERGIGRGGDFTMNFPMPAGTGEGEYLRAFREEIVPALTSFKPDLLLISAGFDAHRDDPLGGMLLDDGSFGKMTALVRDIAPVVSFLEGGYDLDALARSVAVHLTELLLPDRPPGQR